MNIRTFVFRALILMFCLIFLVGLLNGPELVAYIFDVLEWSRLMFADNTLLFVLFFLAIYVGIISLGFPGGALLALLSGYFFGIVVGFFVVFLCTNLSAGIIWLVVRKAGFHFTDIAMERHKKSFTQLLIASPFQTLLILRLIPILPFYFANLISAASGVRFSLYWGSLCLGLLPSSLALVSIGEGVASQSAVQEIVIMDILLHPLVIYPSLVLLALSLGAIYWRGKLVQNS